MIYNEVIVDSDGASVYIYRISEFLSYQYE